jgi:hypothetical protein
MKLWGSARFKRIGQIWYFKGGFYPTAFLPLSNASRAAGKVAGTRVQEAGTPAGTQAGTLSRNHNSRS